MTGMWRWRVSSGRRWPRAWRCAAGVAARAGLGTGGSRWRVRCGWSEESLGLAVGARPAARRLLRLLLPAVPRADRRRPAPTIPCSASASLSPTSRPPPPRPPRPPPESTARAGAAARVVICRIDPSARTGFGDRCGARGTVAEDPPPPERKTGDSSRPDPAPVPASHYAIQPSPSAIERAANTFAGELLAPTDGARAVCAGFTDDDPLDRAVRLSAHYGLSALAAAVKLQMLGQLDQPRLDALRARLATGEHPRPLRRPAAHPRRRRTPAPRGRRRWRALQPHHARHAAPTSPRGPTPCTNPPLVLLKFCSNEFHARCSDSVGPPAARAWRRAARRSRRPVVRSQSCTREASGHRQCAGWNGQCGRRDDRRRTA